MTGQEKLVELRSDEVLRDMIHTYVTDLQVGEAVVQNRCLNVLGSIKELLEMEETAGKLMLACRDLRKELLK